MRVLLVDDEVDFAATVSSRLALRGIGTDVVHDGQQALDYVEAQEPDVMVLDLNMPGLTGMDVLRRVGKNNPNIQVLILTGHGMKKEKEEAQRLKAFDYLSKPTDVDTLAERIRSGYAYKTEKMKAAAKTTTQM